MLDYTCASCETPATKMMSVKDTLDDIEKKLYETNEQVSQILAGLQGCNEPEEKFPEGLNMRDQVKRLNDMSDRIMKMVCRIGENLF